MARGCFVACVALLVACGGKSRVEDGGQDGSAGEPGSGLGGTTGSEGGGKGLGGTSAGTASTTGGSQAVGGTTGVSGSVGLGGASAGTGAGATGGSGGIPGGFSDDAERVGLAWSSAVVQRCSTCRPEAFDSCVEEDGGLVPSPFLLICMSQLAITEPSVAAYLEQWASRAESEAAAFAGKCDPNVDLPPPTALPAAASRCATSDYACPEREIGTACDGVRDCLVGEDEMHCGPIEPTNFCHHGQAVGWERICDGVADCEYGEDELNCPAL